jgi:hypothetical protein
MHKVLGSDLSASILTNPAAAVVFHSSTRFCSLLLPHGGVWQQDYRGLSPWAPHSLGTPQHLASELQCHLELGSNNFWGNIHT